MLRIVAIEMFFKDLTTPNPDPNSVKRFIHFNKGKLTKGQKQLLKLMMEKIYGFYLESHDRIIPNNNLYKSKNTATFKFRHDGAEGQIKITY